MIRAVAISVAVLFCSPALAQPPPKVVTLPSGRKIKIIHLDQMETRDIDGSNWRFALALTYETSLKMTDDAGLEKEGDEVCSWLKREAERGKYTEAIIWPVDSTGDPTVAPYGCRKQPDGAWKRPVATIRHPPQ
jgi:hypothetical protein